MYCGICATSYADKELTAGVGLTKADVAGVSTTLTFAPAQLDAITWSDGANASNIWTFDVSGTDVTLTWGNALGTIAGGWTVSGTLEGGVVTEGGVGVPNVNDNLSVFAATTSAQLAGVLSNETGTGLAVFGTSPTLTTPTIGVATATSIQIGANTVDTNEWAFLDGLNQSVTSGTAPTFTADNFSDGGGNAIITTTQETNFAAAYSHVSNNGSDHSYIDQDVTSGATPTFTGTNFTGVPVTTGLTATNWRVFYSNGSATLIELAFGADGTVLQSNGASAAPTFEVVSGGGGAPTDATYITQTADGDLSAEQALAALSTGIMRVATTTGVITSLTNSAGIAANISDEEGTGVMVFSVSPTLTTPTIGVATATSVQIGANTVDTNEWAFLDGLDQDVSSGASPAFTSPTLTTPTIASSTQGDASHTTWDIAPASDHTGAGNIASVTVDANTYGIASALHLDTDGNYIEADADAATTMPCIALALETGTGTKTILFDGYIRDDTWDWTPGAIIYVSDTVGTLTATAPSGTGDQVQVVGIALTADVIKFAPSLVLVEVS